jgi:prophage DNA circulation protein
MVKTITVTPKEPQPTLVLAYEQYGDTSRVDEIIRRNNIHFPLFMQKVPIRITKSVS